MLVKILFENKVYKVDISGGSLSVVPEEFNLINSIVAKQSKEYAKRKKVVKVFRGDDWIKYLGSKVISFLGNEKFFECNSRKASVFYLVARNVSRRALINLEKYYHYNGCYEFNSDGFHNRVISDPWYVGKELNWFLDCKDEYGVDRSVFRGKNLTIINKKNLESFLDFFGLHSDRSVLVNNLSDFNSFKSLSHDVSYRIIPHFSRYNSHTDYNELEGNFIVVGRDMLKGNGVGLIKSICNKVVNPTFYVLSKDIYGFNPGVLRSLDNMKVVYGGEFPVFFDYDFDSGEIVEDRQFVFKVYSKKVN